MGDTHPAQESHSALEVAGVRIKERGPRAGRSVPGEGQLCQSLLVHRRESLFLYTLISTRIRNVSFLLDKVGW